MMDERLVKVWVRWHDRRFPTSLHISKETCDIADFIDSALQKLKIDESAARVVIAGSFVNVDRSQLVSSILEGISYENPFVFFPCIQPSQPPPDKYRKIPFNMSPFAYYRLKHSPALLGYKDRFESWSFYDKLANTGLIYQHWFALEVYNLSCSLANVSFAGNGESVSVTLNEQNYHIDGDSLSNFVDELSVPEWKIESIKRVEPSHTRALSRSLDRFLFTDKGKTKGACFHKLPVVENGLCKTSTAYFLVCSLDKAMPDRIILAGNYQKYDTYHETVAHCIQSANISGERRVILGLAGGSRDWQLLVCHNLDNHHLQVIKVFKIWPRSDDMWKFACILYACVHYLMDHSVSHDKADDIVARCKDGSVNDHVRITRRVVHCVKADRIHKYYDSKEDIGKHNYDLIDRMKLLPNATLMELSSDQRFHRLSYDFLVQEEYRVVTLQDFVPLLRQLSKLHAEDFVHGNVRCANIIFTSEGAKLINFDLVDKEGQDYPFRANSDPDEYGYSGYPRKKKDDRDAIYKCMRMKMHYVEKVIKDQLLLTETPLSIIADTIENHN